MWDTLIIKTDILNIILHIIIYYWYLKCNAKNNKSLYQKKISHRWIVRNKSAYIFIRIPVYCLFGMKQIVLKISDITDIWVT